MAKTVDMSDPRNCCGSCRYGVDDVGDNPAVICRVNPPTVLMRLDGGMQTQWPMVGRTQVCGDFDTGPRRDLTDEVQVVVHTPN